MLNRERASRVWRVVDIVQQIAEALGEDAIPTRQNDPLHPARSTALLYVGVHAHALALAGLAVFCRVNKTFHAVARKLLFRWLVLGYHVPYDRWGALRSIRTQLRSPQPGEGSMPTAALVRRITLVNAGSAHALTAKRATLIAGLLDLCVSATEFSCDISMALQESVLGTVIERLGPRLTSLGLLAVANREGPSFAAFDNALAGCRGVRRCVLDSGPYNLRPAPQPHASLPRARQGGVRREGLRHLSLTIVTDIDGRACAKGILELELPAIESLRLRAMGRPAWLDDTEQTALSHTLIQEGCRPILEKFGPQLKSLDLANDFHATTYSTGLWTTARLVEVLGWCAQARQLTFPAPWDEPPGEFAKLISFLSTLGALKEVGLRGELFWNRDPRQALPVEANMVDFYRLLHRRWVFLDAAGFVPRVALTDLNTSRMHAVATRHCGDLRGGLEALEECYEVDAEEEGRLQWDGERWQLKAARFRPGRVLAYLTTHAMARAGSIVDCLGEPLAAYVYYSRARTEAYCVEHGRDLGLECRRIGAGGEAEFGMGPEDRMEFGAIEPSSCGLSERQSFDGGGGESGAEESPTSSGAALPASE